ncbi:hypothetical protein GM415_15375 [Pseudodesulfovibrio cashew]|uniref:PepSY domain-containing protein n=1 Tax=Pseudodesulfovibrio cashew TaxID=2678688 RepID=A0A6I6JJX1_9BACT|nr:hypothetical protein [Pseudodesulfovibrio cashew]QGY41439.1 hypothetical protein GM415_15375 [Pseudodesulfovibrio cashew]
MQNIMKNILFAMGIIVVAAAVSVPSSFAMMGGGMQGNGQGGSFGGMMGSGGSMSGSSGSGMTGNQGWNSSGGNYGQNQAVSTAGQAESIVKSQIARNPNLTIGEVVDRENDYMVDVVTHDGSLVDKLIVQKNTGAVRSVNQ